MPFPWEIQGKIREFYLFFSKNVYFFVKNAVFAIVVFHHFFYQLKRHSANNTLGKKMLVIENLEK